MNRSIISLCAALWVCTSSIAQEKSIDVTQDKQSDSIALQELREVVVSDSRFKLKREHSGKTVIKISSEELERNQGKSVAEIINTKSGLEITGSRGREGSVLGVFARGGRGRQVLIVIDGVRVSDPSSSSSEYDIRLLSTANIASVEIIKGASSTLYGTNAATAVINIITKKSDKRKIALNVQSSMGTNQTADDQNFNGSDFSNSARLNGTLNRFSYSAGFSNVFANGLSAIATPENEEDKYSRRSTDVRLGYQFSTKFRLTIYGNHTQSNSDFDESFGLVDADYSYLSTQKRIGIYSVYEYNKSGSLVLHTGYSSYDSENKSAFPSTFEGENLVVDLYHKYNFNNQFYTILGLNYSKDETKFGQNETFEITDPYANVVYVSDFGLNLNLGARFNTHSEYGSHLVYNINPSFTFDLDSGYIKVLSSYATSYITPSLTQLFGNFGANPNLEPEENRTIEGGIEYAVNNKLRLSALYFNRKENNFVFYDGATSTYENSENTIDAQGVEAELNWNTTEKLHFNANYTFTERKGDNAIRIPKHKVNARLAYDLSKRTNVSLGYTLTGKRSDTDFGAYPYVDVPLKSFSLVDFHVGYEMISNKLKVFLSGSNLLNETYTEVLGYTTKGRNFRIGFNLNL